MYPLKYIITNRNHFLIFPNDMIHAEAAQRLTRSCYGVVVGAGFVAFDSEGPKCYGESISLQVKSREEDSELLRKILTQERI